MAGTITVDVPVRRKGQRCYFQVNIQQNITRITGIEAFVSHIALPGGRKTLDGNVAGTVKLQAENRAGLSFISQVWVGEHPIEQLLPGLEDVNGSLTQLFPSPYHLNLYDEHSCSRPVDSYMLYGCYQDILGFQSNLDAAYTVTLCLHVQ